MIFKCADVRQTAIVTCYLFRHVGAPQCVVSGHIATGIHGGGTIYHRIVVVWLERYRPTIVGHVARCGHARILRRIEEAWVCGRGLTIDVCEYRFVGVGKTILGDKVR